MEKAACVWVATARSTSQLYEYPVSGNSGEITCNKLPTYEDVIKCILFTEIAIAYGGEESFAVCLLQSASFRY